MSDAFTNAITIRLIKESDPETIAEAFREQGWNKPVWLYEGYLEEQRKGDRVSLIAEADGVFAGYVNVLWKSYYPPFQEEGIPEINDFNVMIKFRRMGIGSALMDKAEAVIGERSLIAGIGVGIFSSYGNAQILYAKRGYVPDGKGIFNGEAHVEYGESIVVNDDVALYLTKTLTRV
jgi:ribosomal protein S18 acetylase RimI-like enzyme